MKMFKIHFIEFSNNKIYFKIMSSRQLISIIHLLVHFFSYPPLCPSVTHFEGLYGPVVNSYDWIIMKLSHLLSLQVTFWDEYKAKDTIMGVEVDIQGTPK